MRIFRRISFIALTFLSSSCLADVYSGSFMVDSNRGPRPMSITYKFDSSNKLNLKGTVEFTRERGGPCWTTRSIDGSTIKENQVILSAPPSPDLQSLGCNTFDLIGNLDGEKILGKFKIQGKLYEIVLNKQ